MNKLFFKLLFKKKIYILLFLLGFLFCVSISTFAKFENNSKKEIVIENHNKSIELYKEELNTTDDELIANGYSLDYIEKLKIENPKAIEHNEKLIEKIKNDDWIFYYKYLLESPIFIEENVLISTQGDYNLKDETVKISKDILNYLKENNIPSAHPLDYERTAFENPFSLEQKYGWDKVSKKTLLGNNHRLWDFFNSEFVFVYVVIIVFTTGTLFSSLYNEQNKTIRFLKSSGVTENKVLRSELFVGSFVTVLIGIVILKIISIAEFLINGTSSLKYPIVSYSVEKIPDLIEKNIITGYKIVTMYDVLVKSLSMFLLYGLLIFLTSSLVATIVKNTTKTIIATLGLILTLQIFKGHLNPYSYWHIGNIVDGGINVINNNANYSYNKCMMILLAVNISIIIVLFIISIIKNNNRKII